MRNRVRQKSLITILLVFSLCFSLFAGGSGESAGEQPDSFNPSGNAAPGMGMPPGGDPPGPPPSGDGGAPGMPPGGAPGMPMGAAELDETDSSQYFSDLDESTASINAYVDYLYEEGLLTDPLGDGLFRSDDTLTRAELAFMLYGKYRYAKEGFSYGDVPTTEYYYQAVMRGKASGIFEDTKYFDSDTAVTREQAALWIYRSELANGMPGEMASEDVSAYSDGGVLDGESRTAVATLTGLGIFEPDEAGTFSPDREMTRGEIVTILYRLSFLGGGGQAMPGNGGMSAGVDHGTAALTLTEDTAGGTFSSTGDQENAVRVDGTTGLLLENMTIEKTAGAATEGDSSNFYGSNAAFLALNGAEVSLDGVTVNSTADGGNGIFSYGEGTDVSLSNSEIRTSGNNSGGVMVTGGGAMEVADCVVETQGRSSAALRTDRGGGILTVEGGSYTANGEGSPAVYCTADITVEGAVLTATSSEAFVVEGRNSLALVDCIAEGNMEKENVENLQNVMIYQSMSGDAETGRSSFSMKGGSLTSHKGDMIYVTNTACEIVLEDVDLTLSNDTILRVAGNDARNGWGVEGSNGGDCEFLAADQILAGGIIVDSISTLEMTLSEGTVLTGTINADGEGGQVSVILDGSSRWVLTGDSYITALSGSRNNVETNGYTLYIGGDAAEL